MAGYLGTHKVIKETFKLSCGNRRNGCKRNIAKGKRRRMIRNPRKYGIITHAQVANFCKDNPSPRDLTAYLKGKNTRTRRIITYTTIGGKMKLTNPEYLVISKKFKMKTQIDCVGFNPMTGKIAVFEWKTGHEGCFDSGNLCTLGPLKGLIRDTPKNAAMVQLIMGMLMLRDQDGIELGAMEGYVILSQNETTKHYTLTSDWNDVVCEIYKTLLKRGKMVDRAIPRSKRKNKLK